MTDPAQMHETNISIVLLVGDRGVKLKKPVRYPFVDLSTRELRLSTGQPRAEAPRDADNLMGQRPAPNPPGQRDR